MTRWALVVAVAVALVAAGACGSDQDPTLAGPLPSQGSSSSSTGPTETGPPETGPLETVAPPSESACSGTEPAAEAEALRLGVTHGELRAGAAATWRLTVTNTGDAEVELVFGSGQDGDVVLTQDQTEVYRWSDELSFTQAVRCQTLAPGAVARYELPQPVLDVAAGEYQLRASLAATPAPFDVATRVTVEG